jgi:hypothetical protein
MPAGPIQRRQQKESQDRFLRAYAKVGNIGEAAEAASIHRTLPTEWRKLDSQGFKNRFELAQQAFADSLEQIAFQRIREPQGNKGSDILLIFLLKGHLRAKYGDSAVPSDSTAQDLLDGLKEIGKKGRLSQFREAIQQQPDMPPINLP